MNIKRLLVSALLTLSFSSGAVNIILDEKAVNVPLPVGKEIIVTFPQAVTHTELLDEDKATALRQLLRPDGVLMLKAGEPFGEARLIATQLDGNIVVLDLNAEVGAVNHQTINLVVKKPKPVKPPEAPKPTVEKNPNKPDFLKHGASMTKNQADETATIGFNQMVQYGFRHYVGPARLIGQQPAKTVNVSTKGVKHLVRLWGDRLAIKPLKQWHINDHYLTVLLVNNRSHAVIEFDPRALRGRLQFSAALLPVLQPQGSAQDQTLWAVITAEPFNTAIR